MKEKEEENNKRVPTIFDLDVMFLLQVNLYRGRIGYRTPILFKTTDIPYNFSEDAVQSAIEQITYRLYRTRTRTRTN